MTATGDRLTFTGQGGDYFGFVLVQGLLVVVTLGIWIFFLRRARRNWIYRRTFLNQAHMVHKGSILDGLLNALITGGLLLITLGFYLPWAVARGMSFTLSHAHLTDGRRFRFEGRGDQVIGQALLSVLLIPLTLGLAYPWVRCLWLRWIWNNTYLSVKPADTHLSASQAVASVDEAGWRQMTFAGTAGEYFSLALGNVVLSIITLGIYRPWASVATMRWVIQSVYVAPAPERSAEVGTPAEEEVAADVTETPATP